VGVRILVLVALALSACNGSDGDSTPDLGTEATIGLEFVQQRGCPGCHQSSNAADGILSGQSTPAPGSTAYGGNLTPDRTTGLGGWADIEIVRAIRYGVDDGEMTLCPAMPRYDGTDPSQPFLTDVEASAIVAYLRAIPPVQRAAPPSMCPPVKPPPALDLSVPAMDLASPADLSEPEHDHD
jgi:hypothetical protein